MYPTLVMFHQNSFPYSDISSLMIF